MPTGDFPPPDSKVWSDAFGWIDAAGTKSPLMTTAADREALRLRLAKHFDSSAFLPAYEDCRRYYQQRRESAFIRADALIAGPLAETLAQADTAAQAVAERDEARAKYEGSLARCNDLMDRVVLLNAEAAGAEDRITRLSAEVEALRAERDGARQEADNLREGLATLIAEQVREHRTALAADQDKTEGGKPTDPTPQKDSTDG